MPWNEDVEFEGLDDKPSMNIHAELGHEVEYAYPSHGRAHDRELARAHLQLGRRYVVLQTRVEDYFTLVYLLEFPEMGFNSALFKDAR